MQASDVGKPLGPTESGDGRWRPPRHGPRGEAVATSRSAPGSRCRCVQARTPKQANPRRYGSLHAAFAISRRLASADGSGISHVCRLKIAHTSADGTASNQQPPLPSQDGTRVLMELPPTTSAAEDGTHQRVGKCKRHSGLKVRRIPLAPHSSSASRTHSRVRRGSR
jgi:hypothetical protein